MACDMAAGACGEVTRVLRAGAARSQHALVVCADLQESEREALTGAALRIGLTPTLAVSIPAAYEAWRVIVEGQGELCLLAVDVDIQGRGNGLDLAICVGFEVPHIGMLLLNARREDDDRPDPVLGLRLADVRCPVVRRPVTAATLEPAVKLAAQYASRAPSV